jgi:hypothetical protein
VNAILVFSSNGQNFGDTSWGVWVEN